MISYEVSIVGAVAAAVATFVLGFIWYGPLFGKQWMQYMGVKEQDMKKGNMPMAMAGGLVTSFIGAYVLGIFLETAVSSDLMTALMVGFLAWLGFQATILAGSVLWEMKPVSLFMLNAAYQLAAALMMSAILFYL